MFVHNTDANTFVQNTCKIIDRPANTPRNKADQKIIDALMKLEPEDYHPDLLAARREIFIDSIRIGKVAVK